MRKTSLWILLLAMLVCTLTACTQPDNGPTTQAQCSHEWADATCEAAKTCKLCNATEGEALGHMWEDATTQAPKRCKRCQLTEGDPIVTDERFNTNACRNLFGTWTVDLTVTCGTSVTGGFHCSKSMDYTLQMTFRNDGTLHAVIDVKDRDTYIDHLCGHVEANLYAEFQDQGLNKEQADAAMIDTFEMTIAEYAAVLVDEMGIQDDFDGEMVYYASGIYLYMADQWDQEMTNIQFKVENGVLKVSRKGTKWVEMTKVEA